jgi:hypothetical protein
MGRSYWFECGRCGYRAKVAGKADRGLNVFVQTVACQDCKELYDAVTRVRVPAESAEKGRFKALGWRQPNWLARPRISATPPTFQSLLALLPYTGAKRFRWLWFNLQCPVSPLHRVRAWTAPGKCPKCQVFFLEQTVLPYRIWD